eukprot:432444_1
MCMQLFLLLVAWLSGVCQSDHYYWIVAKQNGDLSGWYHLISTPPEQIQSQFNKVSEVYKHGDMPHYFITWRPMVPGNYHWALFDDQKSVIYQQNTSYLPYPRINDTLLETKYIRLPHVDWNTLKLMQTKSDIFYVSRAEFYNLTLQKEQLENDRKKLFQQIVKLHSEQKKYVQMFLFVFIMLLSICTILSIMWYRSWRKTKIYELQQANTRTCINYQQQNKIAKTDKCIMSSQIKNESDNSKNGLWCPEQFKDMLNNSEMVQNVIVDDIINDMQTEGRRKSTLEQLNDIEYDGQLTGFPNKQ